MDGEGRSERVNRELSELLEELRVALPGAEVLFAFLLSIAFTSRIERATDLERIVYFVTLLCTAVSTALLIGPSAYHRLHFRNGTDDKERMIRTATHMAIGALMFLLVAVTGAVYLVASVLYTTTVAIFSAVAVSAVFCWFWFGLPFSRRRAKQEPVDA